MEWYLLKDYKIKEEVVQASNKDEILLELYKILKKEWVISILYIVDKAFLKNVV